MPQKSVSSILKLQEKFLRMGEGALIEFEHPAAVKITAKTKMYRTNLVIPPYFFKYIRQYISESAFIISVGVRDKT